MMRKRFASDNLSATTYRIFPFVLQLALVVCCSNCGGSSASAPASPTPPTRAMTSVTVNGLTALTVGTTSQFSATADFSDASNQTITTQATWTSSNASVASVNNSGLVTAIGTGEADVTATYQNLSGKLHISVGQSTTPSSCTYTLSIGSTIDGYPNGGSFPVTVTTPNGCNWSAVSNTSWIHVASSIPGNGPGTFTFTVDANNTGLTRIGTLTIAGKTVTFNQTPIGSANRPPTPGSIQSSFSAGVLAFTTFTFAARGASDPDGDVIVFKWDFGDGTSGAGATVTKTYATAGTFTVRLTANDGHNPDVSAAPTSVIVRTLTAQWRGTAATRPPLPTDSMLATMSITQSGRTISATCTDRVQRGFPFGFKAGFPAANNLGGVDLSGGCGGPGFTILIYDPVPDSLSGNWQGDWFVTLTRQ